ncbi:MAG: hypothetical protein II830_00500, partial [Alphaproteobacteria bacterium]|nr:hypothetical protein [Alphaproteobacteria bacterium]
KESCGLSKEHFAEMYGYTDKKGNWHEGKITGILARQNKAFDEWNKAHPDDLRQIQVKKPDAMYKELMENLHKARAADKTGTLFAGKTDDQVIYQYIKNVEYSEKVKDGPIVNGVKTLITRVGKDKLPLYASNQDEMQALFKILRCGEKVNVSTESLNATLDRIDMKTGTGIGKEFEIGKTNNSFWGFGPDCGDGVSMWRKGINAVKKVFTKDAEVKSIKVNELEPVDAKVKTLQPVDASVRSVQTRELVVDDADASATYTQANVTLGRGTSDKLDNDLTDPVAQGGKKVGSSVGLGSTYRKLDVDGAELIKNAKGRGSM